MEQILTDDDTYLFPMLRLDDAGYGNERVDVVILGKMLVKKRNLKHLRLGLSLFRPLDYDGLRMLFDSLDEFGKLVFIGVFLNPSLHHFAVSVDLNGGSVRRETGIRSGSERFFVSESQFFPLSDFVTERFKAHSGMFFLEDLIVNLQV
jgi:hypothetical protein